MFISKTRLPDLLCVFILFRKIKNGGIESLNNETEFCIVEFTLCNISRYLLWCTDDKDYFLTDSDKKLVYFPQKEKMEEYCKKWYYQNPSFVSNNFDIMDYHNCNDYLDKWNNIEDLSKTLNIDFIGNHDDHTYLYSKFVYGSNLPALNTSGKKYIPTFDEEEKQQIENVTNDMIRILKFALEIDD